MKVIRYYLHNYFAKYVVDLEDDEIVCDFRNLLRSYRLKYKWGPSRSPTRGRCLRRSSLEAIVITLSVFGMGSSDFVSLWRTKIICPDWLCNMFNH